MTTLLIFGLLLAGLALSIPIFIVLTGTTFLVFALTSPIPLSILPQRVFAGLESFPLLAIPFFFYAATIMSRGGLSRRLIRFVQTLVGHLPGGLGMTVVLTCMIFGSITGSSASTIVAVGSTLYPALLAAGYTSRFALGAVTCSALIGMIIPPSNAMIIYGAVANVSIGALFMSGIGAGLVFTVAYCTYCVGWAVANGVPRTPRATLCEVWSALRDVFWGLGLPAIILGGIYGGIFTATEAAAVSVVYAGFVCLVVYRELDLTGLWEVTVEASLNSARILILVAAASAFSWLMTVSGTAARIASPMAGLTQEPELLLAFVNGLALLTGMFIDVFSNILILVPIILGTMTAAGVSPTHLGIVMTVNVDIGNVTPPFGLNLFVASATFDKPYLTVVHAVLPWLAIAILCLAIITYVPEISLWLPRQLYPGLN
ncbi:MAG: TRAP transporter large permease subunit [Rhizobiales bacterium]|nr:TRAP transporter large permease subunit [Hyphomicrobiales bacterium]